MSETRKRYPKKWLTTTNYVQAQIELEERIKKICSILREQTEIKSDECPGKPVETLQDIFQDFRGAFDLSQSPEDLEDSIAQAGFNAADKIACLSANNAVKLFGGGFVASYVKDFNSHIIDALGISQEPWNEIISVALLYISLEEIPSIVKHWNRMSTDPDGVSVGPVPGTKNHPSNPGGEWYGCEMVSDAIVRGAIQHYGIARLKSIRTLQRAASGSKVATALTALFASPRFIKAMELSTGMGVVMEMDEVKAAREEITIEVCALDSIQDVVDISKKMTALATRIRTGVEDDDDDDDEIDPSPLPPPASPGGSGPGPDPCPTGQERDSSGNCVEATECPEGQIKDTRGNCVSIPNTTFEESKSITLSELREQLKVRGFKGYGSSHPFIDRKPTNLGMSVVEKYIDENKESKKEDDSRKKVKVSKAFTRNRK